MTRPNVIALQRNVNLVRTMRLFSCDYTPRTAGRQKIKHFGLVKQTAIESVIICPIRFLLIVLS